MDSLTIQTIHDFVKFGDIDGLFKISIANPQAEHFYALLFSSGTFQFYFLDFPLKEEECTLVPKTGYVIVGYFLSDNIAETVNLKYLLNKWNYRYEI